MTGHPVYTDRWRDAVRAGAQSSAEVLAPLILDEVVPNLASPRVLDVGCGEGWLVRSLASRGAVVSGVDGSWVDDPDIGHVDLTAPPYPDLGTFDLVVCLEVAEHVDQAHASILVEWLCSMAPTVAFSAAVPGQGGEGHVNEQWPDYWHHLFDLCGRVGSGALRWRVWTDERVCWWYRQNLLVFAPPARLVALDPDGQRLPADGCPAVVHPEMWNHHRPDLRRGRRR